MPRTNIPRTPNGKFETHLEEMDEFAEEVAKNLLEKYPTVDFFDLMYQFESSFRYKYARAMAMETIED